MHIIIEAYEMILKLCHKIKSINFNNQHIKYNGMSHMDYENKQTFTQGDKTKHEYIQTITSIIFIY